MRFFISDQLASPSGNAHRQTHIGRRSSRQIVSIYSMRMPSGEAAAGAFAFSCTPPRQHEEERRRIDSTLYRAEDDDIAASPRLSRDGGLT